MGQSKKQVYEKIFEIEGFDYFFRYYSSNPGAYITEGFPNADYEKINRLTKKYCKAAEELENYLASIGLDEESIYS